MDFPNLVYKCPGVHQCPGNTFNYLSVKNEAELDEACKTGWSQTLPEAYGEKKIDKEPCKDAKNANKESKDNDGPDEKDDAPPTREEILKACDDLNIPYKKNAPSKKLLILIDKQLK